jgi:hypothetical protein
MTDPHEGRKMEKPTAIFIGTQHTAEPLFHEVNALVHVVHIAQWDRGLKAIEEASPRLIVVSGTADRPEPNLFLDRLRQRLPHCRVPAIAADMKGRGLIVQLWDPIKQVFGTRTRPMDDLLAIVRALLRPAASTVALEPLREVGFYNHISVDQRTLHVQTEVLWRDEIRIKSTVLEGGRILYATSQLLPLDIEDVEQGRAFIQAQHTVVLTQAEKRKY